jgi:hypothetical protein
MAKIIVKQQANVYNYLDKDTLLKSVNSKDLRQYSKHVRDTHGFACFG